MGFDLNKKQTCYKMVYFNGAKKDNDKENTVMPEELNRNLKRSDFDVKLHKEGCFPSKKTVKKIEKIITYNEKLHFVVSCEEDQQIAYIVLRDEANKSFPAKVIEFYEKILIYE